MKVTTLSGGVGGARFLEALLRAEPSISLTVIVNTGDDRRFHGLAVCPDLDSVIYALAGESDRERGWGLASESFRAFEALRRLDGDAWFQLGDRDLGTHLFRTERLLAGEGLAEVTSRIGAAFGVRSRVLPMTEAAVSTRLTTDLGELDFQEYHVRERSRPAVSAVRYEGADRALPAPGVLEAIRDADVVLVAPSNPVSSIGPVLAVPGIVDALSARTDRVVALSGLRGGAPFRGDADRLLAGLGLAVSPLSVAECYVPWLGGMVIDTADAELRAPLEAQGLVVQVRDTRLDGAAGASAAAACLHLARKSVTLGTS